MRCRAMARCSTSRPHTCSWNVGLQRIKINVTELDDDYEEVYKLPFARTRDNILRFKELAGLNLIVKSS